MWDENFRDIFDLGLDDDYIDDREGIFFLVINSENFFYDDFESWLLKEF